MAAPVSRPTPGALDVVLAGVHKALAAPPGLVCFTLSERAAERAAALPQRGFYTDLLRYRDKHRAGGTITTPAVSGVYALDRQLDRMLAEGMESRWARHRQLQAMTAAWAAERGFTFPAPEPARSPTVSCLRPPAGIAAPDLVAGLAERGFIVGGGYGPWKPETFRIGHMGEVRAGRPRGAPGRDRHAALTSSPALATSPLRSPRMPIASSSPIPSPKPDSRSCATAAPSCTCSRPTSGRGWPS